jgi:UDPglucose--hexose-1-phosphate uridylyltransferase
MVPKSVKEEILGAHRYYEYRDRCIYCDMIRQESQDKERIILENKYFIAFCPFVSRFPFEIWIVPKKHNSFFCLMSPEEVPALAVMLKDIVTKVKKTFKDPAYNFIVHSSPLNGDSKIDSYHWHIEFMPKLTRVAGFEWGTGFYVVPTPPEMAAQFLRGEFPSAK